MEQIVTVTSEYIHDILDTFIKQVNANTEFVQIDKLTNQIYKSIKKEISQDVLYDYIANFCADRISYHPDFNKLASRFVIHILHNQTTPDFKTVIDSLYDNIDCDGNHSPLIDKNIYEIVRDNSTLIQNEIDFNRDYYFDFFGIKTLERSYLQKIRNTKKDHKIIKINKIVERPQHMFMRVALGVHDKNLKKVFETYHLMSKKMFTHATPTLFNSGMINPQMSSCYLLDIGDSLHHIFDKINDIANLSKWAGGIGVSISNIRAKNSIIRKTNGESNGIIPLCKVLNSVANYINQGGKRNGSIAVYLELWHPEIFAFCDIRKNTESEESKCRDLFIALWTCDLFMKRVENNESWSLMCPNECPGLTSVYGEEFEKLYISYEKQGKYRKQIRAVTLWYHILGCQIETGMPYMLYKDHANAKSNQKNLGVIRCSNLCTEIIEYTDDYTIAVCNLASICLPRFIETIDNKKVFNFNHLIEVSKIIVRNLDIIIDKNYYPCEKSVSSNMKNRPVGVGVQGLADVYNKMGYPFDSPEAFKLNRDIFEALYYGCLTESNQLAIEKGPYENFVNSPASKGEMQFHMWKLSEDKLNSSFDWKSLIDNIKKHGLRNSLLTTVMPTASTSQIMGNSESIDPYLSNVFTRSTLAGEFIVINENLVHDLTNIGLWSENMRKKIIMFNGSIEKINEIPQYIRDIYKTAFELKLKTIIQQSVERGPFIDQSQSLNLFMDMSDFDKLTSAHFYGWKNGLKTGMYYLRSKPSVDPIQYGLEIEDIKKITNDIENDKKINDNNNNNDNDNNNNNDNDNNEVKYCVYRKGVKVANCSSCT